MAIAYVCQLLLGSIASMDRHDAAQRTSADQDDIPPRLVFDPPDEIDATLAPISDTLKLAASLGIPRACPPKTPKGEHKICPPPLHFRLSTIDRWPRPLRYCATAAQLGMDAKKTSLAVWAAFCPVQER